jgi:outer membrane lipoprotein-sorting protein
MSKKTITKVAIIFLWTVSTCWAACECPQCLAGRQPEDPNANAVESILKQLKQKTAELKSYQGQLEYKFIQPLLESEALRKGVLYYARFGKQSKLRINFETLKQDDEKEQKYTEQFIFDGIWLTHIDHQIKAVKRYELTEPNKPLDAFDVAGKSLPIIGFAKTDDLKKQFEVKLVEQKKDKPESLIHLHLKVKPDSIYKDDYTSIDFWIDKELGLPAKVIAVSTEEDLYEIKFLKPKLNKNINKEVFEYKIPKGFGEPEIIPLKKRANQDD